MVDSASGRKLINCKASYTLAGSVSRYSTSVCGNQGATYRCDVGQKTINVLSEDVLLEMFTFYVYEDSDLDGWQKLVHVCRKWRSVVFASPHPLNLQLLCTNKRPVEKMLDIWPALPIVLSGGYDKVDGIENIIAALEHNIKLSSRILQISYWEESEQCHHSHSLY